MAVRPPGKSAGEHLCRAVNVVVATVGIVVSLPLMAVIAGLIKLTSKGPVVFTQTRIGVDRRRDRGEAVPNQDRRRDLGGQPFTIYKFRTMREDPGGARQVWAAKNDARVTPVGRVLRATRLDELPQFFNVLKGDMNIVGPRPEQPQIFAELRDRFGDAYQRRQRVLPGITGLAQVNLGYDETLNDVRNKVSLDLEYIRRRSTTADLTIMAKTLPVMVLRKERM